MNTINVENCKTLLIGRRGENEVTTVAFDFTEWASEFGSGVVDLYVKRFGDDSAYPVVLTVDGTVASWLVTETDTNVAGYGKAEYVYRVDGKIAKSAVFPFFVAEDIGQPASEPPDPYESWLEQLTALGAETEAHAQAAEQSAEDAAQSAASAEGYAGQSETAAGLAQAAQTASEAARDAAQTAQASAESSATAASGSAASAASSATAAAGSASDASSSASAASDSATAAGDAETQAEAAKTAAQAAQSAAEDAAADAQQAAQQAHIEYEQLSDAVDDLSDEVTQQKSAIEDLQALTNRKAGMLVDTASGSIASFVPDATIRNLLGVTVDIEPVQAGSGAPSPDNVRPISGWDAVEVDADGVNLFGGEVSQLAFASYSEGDMIISHATYRSICARVKSGKTYTVSRKTIEGNRFRVAATVDYPAREVPCRILANDAAQDNALAVTVTIPDGYNYIFVYLSNQSDACTAGNYQIELGSIASAFKPFAGNRYTIQLGQTVYGGTLDVTNGTNESAFGIVDLGTLTWTYRGNGVFTSLGVRGYCKLGSDICYCSAYKGVSAAYFANLVDKSIQCGNSYYMTGAINIKDTAYSDAAILKAALAGVQLVYELATPIVIDLDPVQIATVAGQTNNLWSDAGDVDVTYAADIKTYIDRLNQPTEDDMIANTLIASGKYFTINNRLFLSTASIAAGAMIIPGTNCQETSLAAALNALNA